MIAQGSNYGSAAGPQRSAKCVGQVGDGRCAAREKGDVVLLIMLTLQLTFFNCKTRVLLEVYFQGSSQLCGESESFVTSQFGWLRSPSCNGHVSTWEEGKCWEGYQQGSVRTHCTSDVRETNQQNR